MFSKTFIVAEDEDIGNVGLKPPWIPISNAGEGSLIAHDMFEHSAKARFNATEEEFMAIGAAYRIRGENGFFNTGFGFQRDCAEVLGNDVYSILTDLTRGNNGDTRFIRAPRRTYKLKDEEAERVCQQAASKGIQMAVSEWRQDFDDDSEVATGTDSRVIMEALAGNYSFAELKEIIVGWMRIGYMNVRRRFPNADLYGLAYMYENIGKSASHYTDECYVGCRIRVTVDMKRCSCKVTNLDEYADY